MKIDKVINNNIISAYDGEGREVVVMGRGLGFKAKIGQDLAEEKIEKVFRLDSQKSIDNFKALLEDLPLEHIQISSDIIDYAKKSLDKKLNKNIYVTLTDHISFAIERYSQGLNFSNPLLYEIKMFYRNEFEIGQYALDLINSRLGIQLPEDEAAAITLHIVNAEYDVQMGETIDITKLISNILDIVKTQLQMEIDEQTLHYERFITHLKFFAQRIYKKIPLNSDDAGFRKMIQRQYPEEYKCSLKIASFIEKEYKHKVTSEELVFLTVHIRRVRSQGDCN